MKTSYINKLFYGFLLCAISTTVSGQTGNPDLGGAGTSLSKKSLPRSTPEAEKVSAKDIANYLDAVKQSGQDIHSLMVLRHGKVVFEHWLGDNAADKPHILNSVSKTFTATAIGFAVTEHRLKVTDKVISFFPDKLPATISPYLKELEIRHLLTMSVGQNQDSVNKIPYKEGVDWVKSTLAFPITKKPGTTFGYNNMAVYLLSAIIQKVTGEKEIDYLTPRLFSHLGIVGARWEESPQGINTGAWGLYIKTEDMAKFGQLILQKGKWNGKQVIAKAWLDKATSCQIATIHAGAKPETMNPKPEDSDWLQGYCYNMWICRHNAIRADGSGGQYIILLPEKDAVIVTTANVSDMQAELNLIWKYLLPAFE